MGKSKLEAYLEDYTFTDSSRIRRDGDVLWLPEVFCQNGHSMMSASESFDGHNAIHVLLRTETDGTPEDYFLSPILNDPRKKGPDVETGATCSLSCPSCREELKRLIPCDCQVGAYRRAIYITPDPEEMGAVGVCEIFGCPQFFVTEDGELLYELLVDGGP